MIEILVSILSVAIVIPFVVLFIKIYNENQAKKDRRERLYFSQRRLHKMALQFRDECMAETKQVIAQYTAAIAWKSFRHRPDYLANSFITDYKKAIDSRKKEYLGKYAIIYSEGDNSLRIEAEELPDYILDEYEAEITEIANTFRDISYYMEYQISDLIEKYNKLERS